VLGIWSEGDVELGLSLSFALGLAVASADRVCSRGVGRGGRLEFVGAGTWWHFGGRG
jgi:hypothetical protein